VGRQTSWSHTIHTYIVGFFFRFSTNRPLANPFLIYYTRFHPRCYIPQNPPLISFAPTPGKKWKRRKFIAFLVHKSFASGFSFADQKRFFLSQFLLYYGQTFLLGQQCLWLETPIRIGWLLSLRAIYIIIIFHGISVNTQREISVNKFSLFAWQSNALCCPLNFNQFDIENNVKTWPNFFN